MINVSGAIGAIVASKGHKIFSISPTATVFDAIQMMAEKNIGALLVMEGSRLVGIVSERDYTRKVALRGRSSKQMPVAELVSTPTITVTPSHTVEDCMRIMTEHRIRHLPVMEGDTVTGVISIGDMVNWIITTQRETISQLESYISGQYYPS